MRGKTTGRLFEDDAAEDRPEGAIKGKGKAGGAEVVSDDGVGSGAKIASEIWHTAYTDGGARGNPGPAGFGVSIEDESGRLVAELNGFLGIKTNNFAEYSGMLAALQWAIENGCRALKVVSDSELMVKQMKGQYKVASPDLRPLYDEAKRQVARLGKFRIEHVLRGKNKNADRLANQAMDEGVRGKAAPKAAVDSAAKPPATKGTTRSRPLRGLVKGGVVVLLEGEIAEGTIVLVMPEKDLRG